MARPPRGWGRAQNKPRPDGALRRSQAVTTFGPGAMMDLVHQAVLVGGLDFWSWEKSEGATTDRGQSRNVELGVLIDDSEFGARVVAQWRALVDEGVLVATPIG